VLCGRVRLKLDNEEGRVRLKLDNEEGSRSSEVRATEVGFFELGICQIHTRQVEFCYEEGLGLGD